MRRRFHLSLILLLLGVALACSLFKPSMSDDLKAKINKVLEDGSTLNAMTEQGVNFSNFGQQLAKTKGDYDLAVAVWPDNVAPETKKAFDQAFIGWNYAYYLWDLKIGDKDTPTEPNINKFDDIISYAGAENLRIEMHDYKFIVENYRGKKYLPFDENIGILLSIASAHFKEAQQAFLNEK